MDCECQHFGGIQSTPNALKKSLKIGIFSNHILYFIFFILGKLIGGNEQTQLLIARTHTRHNFNIHWNSERAMKHG